MLNLFLAERQFQFCTEELRNFRFQGFAFFFRSTYSRQPIVRIPDKSKFLVISWMGGEGPAFLLQLLVFTNQFLAL